LRGYEIILIADPEITEDEITSITNKLTETITHVQGRMVKVEKWGKRKLSHRVKKSPKGYYVIFYFMAPPNGMKEIERTLRYNEKILRYQTILTGVAPVGVETEEQPLPAEKVVSPEEALSPPEDTV